MKKVTKYNFGKLTLEELIEGFVSEAALEGLGTSIGTIAQMNEHGDRSRAFGDEIVSRDGGKSLLPLLNFSDNWIAYSAAVALVILPDTKETALETLDRIADERSGRASSSANTGRNMVRYGNPLGAPDEVEKRLAEIRSRYDQK